MAGATFEAENVPSYFVRFGYLQKVDARTEKLEKAKASARATSYLGAVPVHPCRDRPSYTDATSERAAELMWELTLLDWYFYAEASACEKYFESFIMVRRRGK